MQLRIPFALFLFAAAALADSGDGFLGRWDLTITAGSVPYPSWLEVTRADGKVSARFVGRGGSVRPARAELTGDELQFFPERQSPRAKASAAKESYRGR